MPQSLLFFNRKRLLLSRFFAPLAYLMYGSTIWNKKGCVFMQIYSSVLLFSLGACFGSFLLLVGMRVPEKRPIALARSQCGHCRKTLQALDLFPLLSFLLLRGRCRYCHQKIPSSHFWFEVTGGIVFLVLHGRYGQELSTFFYYTLVYSILFILSAVDVHYLYFPDRFQIVLLLLLLFKADQNGGWPQALLGGIVLLLLFSLAERLSPGGMGGGDRKLLLTFALTLGMPRTLTILFWSSLACLLAFGLRSLTAKLPSSLPLPFGPFLAIGFFLVQEGFLTVFA